MRIAPAAAALILTVSALSLPVLAQDASPEDRPAQDAATSVVQAEQPLGPLIVRRTTEIGARSANREDLAAIAAYYTANPDKPLWVAAGQLSQRGAAAVAEIMRADDWGLTATDFDLPAGSVKSDRSSLADTEARLSLAVLKYARHARGGRMDPTQLGEAFDRQPTLRNPRQVLDEIAGAADPDAYLRKLHPQHPQFERLRQLYLSLKAGKRTAAVAVAATTETTAAPGSNEQASGRSGRNRNRAAAAKPAAVPETVSARRVLLNMEQWRWMPEDLGNLYVTVNIPEFTLRVVKNGQAIHTERVIAGEVSKPTPIFSMDMQSVVFHPGWGVPNSIKVKELLPGLASGRDPLTRQGLRATYRGRVVDPSSIDWQSVDIRNVDVVQPPGPSNVLGVVKFQFPNKHDVYMHDTPTKHLFNADVRAFSHGCMRVRDPVRLAEIVLAETAGWSPQKVASLVKGGPMDNKVMLPQKIPVHITYFTVTVDDAGKETVFRDVYGHEPKIQLGLEGKAHLVPKPKENLGEARARVLGRSQYSGGFGGSGGFFGGLFSGF